MLKPSPGTYSQVPRRPWNELARPRRHGVRRRKWTTPHTRPSTRSNRKLFHFRRPNADASLASPDLLTQERVTEVSMNRRSVLRLFGKVVVALVATDGIGLNAQQQTISGATSEMGRVPSRRVPAVNPPTAEATARAKWDRPVRETPGVSDWRRGSFSQSQFYGSGGCGLQPLAATAAAPECSLTLGVSFLTFLHRGRTPGEER